MQTNGSVDSQLNSIVRQRGIGGCTSAVINEAFALGSEVTRTISSDHEMFPLVWKGSVGLILIVKINSVPGAREMMGARLALLAGISRLTKCTRPFIAASSTAAKRRTGQR